MVQLIHTYSLNGQEAILLDSSPEILEWLRQKFNDIAGRGPENLTSFSIQRGDLICSRQNIRVNVIMALPPTPSHMIRHDTEFSWFISPEDAERFADLILGLQAANAPSHQYLEIDNPDCVTFVVSKGEYNDATLTDMSKG